MADPEGFDADPDPTFHANADPDPTFHANADPVPNVVLGREERKKILQNLQL